MSQKYSLRITAALFCVALAACGGSGGGSSDTPAQNATNTGSTPGSNDNGTTKPGGIPPSSGSSGGTPPSGDSGGNTGSPPTTTPPASPFAATVTQAPADGATISGTVRILVSGSGIRNVELLPATGYQPLIARGVVNGDNKGAYIDLDTTFIPDGPVTYRVAAFNALPSQGGSEITAMRARTWTVKNSTAPAFAAQLVSAPPEVPPASGKPQNFVVSGTNLGNVELVSAKDETIVYGRFTISADKTRATLPWNYRATYDNKSYDTYQLRILAWDVPPGESGKKIEVMAPRTYRGLYNPGCQTCGGEAP